jgi:hypothetical protein
MPGARRALLRRRVATMSKAGMVRAPVWPWLPVLVSCQEFFPDALRQDNFSAIPKAIQQMTGIQVSSVGIAPAGDWQKYKIPHSPILPAGMPSFHRGFPEGDKKMPGALRRPASMDELARGLSAAAPAAPE